MAFLCCDESINFIFMTLTYNVFCRVTSEDVISMNLFTVLETIGWTTERYCYLWISMIYHITTLHIHSVSVVSQLNRGWYPQSLVMVTSVVTLWVRMMHE
jgi:hypothetical protein